jgi:glycosyltransferase involved in cell wall biosynthesis
MYTDQNMATIYNAFDVLLNPALSEGFGLPMLEAQMCGIPIIANEFSTTKELTFAGWHVGGMRIWSFGAKSWRIMCDPAQITAALSQAYDELSNPKRAKKLSKQARAGATILDDKIVGKTYWKPALESIEKMACGGGKLELVTF